MGDTTGSWERMRMNELKLFSHKTNIECCSSLQLCSKLTRESGTDFPIPAMPGMADNETEKLIREKDEEVRHADRRADSLHQHDLESEHDSDPHEHSESPSHHLGDEAL